MLPATEKLYFHDPWQLSFTGRVLARSSWNEAPSLVLDRTLFYPEAGGQLGDRGTLGPFTVTDTQIDDAGVIHHLIAQSAVEATPETLEGSLDRARRRAHMALHTAQHLLSRALLDVAEAATVSSRLGETECTIDVERYKGKMRVIFTAGPRARGELKTKERALQSLAAHFTCGPQDVMTAVQKLQRELEAARVHLGALRSRLAEQLVTSLSETIQSAPDHWAIASVEQGTQDLLRAIAGRLTTIPGAIIALAGEDEQGRSVLLARHADASVDCGALLKRITTLGGGRGGGRKEYAEGRLPATAHWEALVAQARQELHS